MVVVVYEVCNTSDSGYVGSRRVRRMIYITEWTEGHIARWSDRGSQRDRRESCAKVHLTDMLDEV